MKITLLLAPVLCAAALLTGCGTVTHVTPTAGRESNIQKYDRVIVMDFVDGVSPKAKSTEVTRKRAVMAVRTKSFADWIAAELGAKNVFREVVRTGTPDANTLVIGGTITRYEDGDSFARLMIGFGAGSSYFDSTLEFKDGGTSEIIASQKVDKNSWALGGGIAATQTPDGFMQEAAKRLATDIASLKLTGKLPPAEQSPATGKGNQMGRK